MGICPICNKEFKNVGAHQRMAHKKEETEVTTAEDTFDEIEQEDTEAVDRNQIKVTKHTNKTMVEKDLHSKSLRERREQAFKEAQRVAGPDELRLHSVDVAEILVTHFGYKNVVNLHPEHEKGIKRKTYVIAKI